MRSGFARTALALALALASGAACALGLGQIEVKSRAGQPLLAEIPVISSGPDELAQLRAGLASPETFQRIGLQPPQGIVTDLRFTLAVDRAGQPVIRVTSSQPVNQPLLTFLIEVDWGQGRLTREYSALLDAPRTVSAPMQPPIQAAAGAASNTIERPLEAPLPFGAQPQATDPLSVENQLDRYEPGGVTPAPPPAPTYPADPIALQPEPPPPAQPPPSAQPRPNAGVIPRPPREPRPVASAPAAEGDITVQRGQTLSAIAADMGGGQTLNQTMIALLRANPEAFIGGNINRLRQGAVLRLPPGNQLTSIDPREASELVRAQIQQWRQGEASPAVPQPIALAPDRVARAPVAPAAKEAAGARADARLEIVPPGASRATRAGAQSGISAGGEGEMVRQEMQQANETIAARDLELSELKNKVAELEKLQKDQQKLIALKDSELASSQQRLSEQQARGDGASPLPWVFGGLGVLALLVIGWVLSRREPKRPNFRAPGAASFEPASPPLADPVAARAAAGAPDPVESLRRRPDAAPAVIDPVAQLLGTAEAEPASRFQAPVASAAAPASDPAASEPEPSEPEVTAPVAEPAAPFWTAPKSEAKIRDKVPTWHSAEVGSAPSRRVEHAAIPVPVAPIQPVLVAAEPAAPTPAAPLEPERAAAATRADVAASPSPSPTPGLERIELARAYLDLGDESSARQLLGEVLINGDHAARQQAARLLRELEASS